MSTGLPEGSVASFLRSITEAPGKRPRAPKEINTMCLTVFAPLEQGRATARARCSQMTLLLMHLCMRSTSPDGGMVAVCKRAACPVSFRVRMRPVPPRDAPNDHTS